MQQVRWLLLRALSPSAGVAAADALPRVLVEAATTGNVPRLHWLLEVQSQHPDLGRINRPCDDGQTALEAAANNGHTACVRALLGDFRVQDRAGRAALRHAACRRCAECCACTHTNAAECNNYNCNCLKELQRLPAFLSAPDGESDVVASALATVASKLLLRCAYFNEQVRPACLAAMLTVDGVDHNTIGIATGSLRSPIFLAARWGRANAVAVLLAAPGINVNYRDIDCATPLMSAAEHGHADCVEALLAAPGVDTRADGIYVMWRRVIMLLRIVPLPQLPFPGADLRFLQWWSIFCGLMCSLSTPTALHKASSSCLLKALFLDVSVVADYARCIRLLLSHNALDRRHRNVLERCLAVPENLVHSFAALVMEARCTFSPANVTHGVHNASGGLRGDESSLEYLTALMVASRISMYITLFIVPCVVFMAALPHWVPWVLWVASAFWFMGMRSVRETLLVLVLIPIICFMYRV